MMPEGFRDPRLEEVLLLEGVVPQASDPALKSLETFAERPIALLAEEYWGNREGADRTAQDRVASSHDEATVVDYSRDTSQYLYELTYVEGSVKRQGWLRVLEQACHGYRLRHVLDLGGGIGTVSRHLQRRGIRCDHLDVPGRTFEYARWRFGREGLDIAMHDATQRWPRGPYDAVIAWDVLEHLKRLEEKVGWLAERIRAGGFLIHRSTFTECEGVHLPENHVYGDVAQYDALLRRHGFRYRGQLKPSRASRLLRRLGWSAATLGVRVSPRLKFGGCFLIHERAAISYSLYQNDSWLGAQGSGLRARPPRAHSPQPRARAPTVFLIGALKVLHAAAA